METHFSLNALFPTLDIANVTAQNVPEERATDMDATQRNSESPNADLLWQDVDNLSIPDSPQLQQKDNDIIISQNPTSAQSHQSSLASTVNSTSSPSTESSSATAATAAAAAAAAAAVFNISWGGNDKPPAELHLDRKDEAETMVSRKPLPKPRGVKRLPEPEPAEDGTLDEETLRRRRNTFAARRSRMKKFLKIEYLENRVNALQTENAKLVLNNALLESEKKSWLAKEAEYKKRIKALEIAASSQNRDDNNGSSSPLCVQCQRQQSQDSTNSPF